MGWWCEFFLVCTWNPFRISHSWDSLVDATPLVKAAEAGINGCIRATRLCRYVAIFGIQALLLMRPVGLG